MGKKKPQVNAQASFAAMVGNANQKALQPYIDQVIDQKMNNFSNALTQKMMTRLAIASNRVEALETVIKRELSISQEELNNVLFDLEDQVTGYKKTDQPAQNGDLLRLRMRVKPIGKDYGAEAKQEFSNLGNPPYALGMPMFENALIGISAGETKVVELDEALKNQVKVEAFEFTIDRVSENLNPKKVEAKNGESNDAPEPVGGPETGKVESA